MGQCKEQERKDTMTANPMSVGVRLDLEKVAYDKNGVVHMMATLRAPDVSKDSKRNPVCVCAVIDSSGSMGGSKIDNVRRSVWKMIDHMTDEDSLALVFFDERIETCEFRRMTSANKEVMRQAVAKVYSRGSTDIGSALVAAGRLFAQYEGAANSVERVMLLTDGQANVGATAMSDFEPILAGVRKGVTTSTFGYGNGFNEELLTAIARQAKGNPYFIEGVDSVAKVFAAELGGLLTCFAQDIVLSIKSHKGASVTNVLNDMDVSTRQDADGELVTEVKVGDVYAGERRDVIVRLEFEKRPQALPRPVTLADVRVSYRTMADAQSVSEEAKVKVELVKSAADATAELDKEIAEQVAILEAANVMAEAKKMADAGNWQGAKSFIGSSTASLRRMKTAKTAAFADGMDKFADQLDVDYCAGGSLSKSIGTYAYAASASRGLTSLGNSAGDSLDADGAMNCVMSALVADFSGSPAAGSVSVGTTTAEPPDVTNPPSTGYAKTRSSK